MCLKIFCVCCFFTLIPVTNIDSEYTLVGTKFPYFVKKISMLVSFLSSAGIKAQNGPIKCVSLVSLSRLIKKLFL